MGQSARSRASNCRHEPSQWLVVPPRYRRRSRSSGVYACPATCPAYSCGVSASKSKLPLSNTAIFRLPPDRSRARVMPAAPAPTMQISTSTVKRCGRVLASTNIKAKFQSAVRGRQLWQRAHTAIVLDSWFGFLPLRDLEQGANHIEKDCEINLFDKVAAIRRASRNAQPQRQAALRPALPD